MSRYALLVLAVVSSAVAQFVQSPQDLTTAEGYAGINVRYKQVPTGICELDPNVKSFSGYSDIEDNQHIFWWFFEARKVDPETAPLTVWINGGPGSSSMIGQFQELGPCFVNSTGEVYNNPYSWSEVSNMIFIDHPAQVGFSYSEAVRGSIDYNTGGVVVSADGNCPYGYEYSCGTFSAPNQNNTANSTANAAPGFWKTLQGFMGAFPQYSRDAFNFGTESYGGHYAPVFSAYIQEQNEKGIGHPINLKSVLIGNGWFDPILQYPAFYNFTVSPGNTYDYKPFNETIEKQMFDAVYGEGRCVENIQQCYDTGNDTICSDTDISCANEIEFLLDDIADRSEYDIRFLHPDPFPPEYYFDYLNTEKVQKAIGAYVNFTVCSGVVADAFAATGDDGKEAHTIEDMQSLIKDNVTVVMYFGDADYICNWLGGEAVAAKVSSDLSKAGYTDILTSDEITHGQVRQIDNFAFVRIYHAAHLVPYYQPLVSLEMFERVINGKDIETGEKTVYLGSGYLTEGTPESTFREGIDTVQFTIVPTNATYNTAINQPDPYPGQSAGKPAVEDEEKTTARRLRKRSNRMRRSPV